MHIGGTPNIETPATPRNSGIYRGWYIAAVSALSIGAVLGTVQFTFSLFIIPLEDEFGWTRTQVNGALSIGIISSLMSPIMGNILDRFGSKWTMAISVLLVAIAFVLRSVMTELWQFYLFTAIMFAGTPGATMLPAGKLVMTWFPSIRGRMMGRVTAGNNIGSGIATPVVASLITLVGWRWTFGVLGIALFGLAIIIVLVISDNPDDVENEKGKKWSPPEQSGASRLNPRAGLSVSAVLHSQAFWLLAIGMTLQQFLRTAVVSQMVPHLQQVGFSFAAATSAMIVLAIGGASSKLIFGQLSETVTARIAFVMVMALQFVGLLLLTFAGGSLMAWVAIPIFGLGMGGVGALTPLVVAEMFGVRNLGTITGLTRASIGIPVVAGPIMAGLIYDNTGKYELMHIITMAFLVVSIACFVFARRPEAASVNN